MKTNTTMKKSEAYTAMYYFIEQIYDIDKSAELGALLGAMSLLDDGDSVDPSMTECWNEAVEFATSSNIEPLFRNMFNGDDWKHPLK